MGANATRHFKLGLGASPCANGETHEFFLTLDGERVPGAPGVFKTIRQGDSIPSVASKALLEILKRTEQTATFSLAPTSGSEEPR